MTRSRFTYVPCFFLLLIILLAGCEQKESGTPLGFALNCESSLIEGSFVQNAKVSAREVFVLHYTGTCAQASISAKEVNGLYVSATTVTLGADGVLRIPIEGTPIDTGLYTLKVTVQAEGRSYYCSQLLEVYQDMDPNAAISWEMDAAYDSINGLVEPLAIPFVVQPALASISVATAVEGLSIRTQVDKKTGKGTLTLTPADNFLGGNLTLIVAFGARTPLPVTLTATPFVSGNGSLEQPYGIDNAALLVKLRYLLDKNFVLTADIDLQNQPWQPVGTVLAPFAGRLTGQGLGHTISNISITGTDNVALFAYTAPTAALNNITIKGSVTGQNTVAGLVAVNKGSVHGCNATDMQVSGRDVLAGLVANNTDGYIINSTPTEVLQLGAVPSMIAEITTTVSKTLAYTPTTATATIVQQPDKVTASIADNVLTLTPEVGFDKSQMSLRIALGNVWSVRTIDLFASEQFDGGDGSPSNPYTIIRASQLNKIRDYTDKNFLITADIDLSELGAAWVPIPSFSGTIDGGNHQITNFAHAGIATKGGFITTNTGYIKNLYFPAIDISNTAAFGVLVGDHSVGTIDNVVITGTLSSTNTGDLLGGVVAELGGGTISNVYVKLTMATTCGMTGGIVGRAKSGATPKVVDHCTSEGSISITASKTRIAGIVGRAEGAVEIKQCLSTMDISSTLASTNSVGGIFGANSNTGMSINACMFAGTIKGVYGSGGIAGVGANVTNCLVVGKPGATVANPTLNAATPGSGAAGAAGAICGTSKVKVTNSIARGVVLTGGSTASLPMAGIVSTFQEGGYASGCVVLNSEINATTLHGIAGTAGNSTGVNANNYTFGIQYSGGYTPTDNAGGLDGATLAATPDQAWYEGLGYNFTDTWDWSADGPVLRGVGYQGSITIP